LDIASNKFFLKTKMTLEFTQPDIFEPLLALSAAELDTLDFGVIGFGGDTVVCDYNDLESKMAGLSKERVIGHPLFTMVAPCMNNFMVAQQFEDAADTGQTLDLTLGYVLTLRMRPVKVQLRLLAGKNSARRFVLVNRRP
jgi:photoactive yellow protein